jgi:pimeloyl-ACP methyl ester carboxylesterase
VARWPDKETVGDRSQGAQLAKLRPLVEYWGSGYDWRKVETSLNALPQFITEIDGLDIQFAHIRSPHDDALPLLMTHGWPGSIVELLKVIDPLTNPTPDGGRPEDAFHLVLPTLPGYGFSGKPTVPPDILRHLRNFDHALVELTDREKVAYDRLLHFYRDGFGYAAMMNQSPQTIGYSFADSPVGMAAYYTTRSPSGPTATASLKRSSSTTRCSTPSRCIG